MKWYLWQTISLIFAKKLKMMKWLPLFGKESDQLSACFDTKVKVMDLKKWKWWGNSYEISIPVQALQNRLALPRRACGQRHQVVVVYIHPLLYHFDQEMQFLIRCNSQIVQSRNYLGRLAAVSEHWMFLLHPIFPRRASCGSHLHCTCICIWVCVCICVCIPKSHFLIRSVMDRICIRQSPP